MKKLFWVVAFFSNEDGSVDTVAQSSWPTLIECEQHHDMKNVEAIEAQRPNRTGTWSITCVERAGRPHR